MATLTEELNKFHTARYGEDVRDAFVACIEKIHAENISVTQLRDEMKEAADQFGIKEQELEAKLQAALNDYLAKYDSVKAVAEASAATANSAEATASNAEFAANEALDAIQQAVALANALDNKVDALALQVDGKIDDAFVEAGALYLTSNSQVVAGPFTGFGGGGGGGGGGGSTGNNAVLSVSNTSGWLSKTTANGKTVEISFYWESIEDDLPTGSGFARVQVNGVVKQITAIPQGAQTLKVQDFLSVGSNVIKLTITDSYENSRTINFSVNVIDLSLSSTFDATQVFTGNIAFPYTPVGSAAKTVHIVLDGKEIQTVNTSASGRQLTYMIPSQSHGAHKLRVWFDATINGETISSNELYYELICVNPLAETAIITSSFTATEKPQYAQILIPYVVYLPNSLTAEIELRVNGLLASKQTVDRTQQLWSYRSDTVGPLTLQIVCGEVTKTFELNITESEIDVEAETENLALYLTSSGRSNNEEHPDTWTSGDIATTFSGFNWSSDGWQHDDSGVSVMRVGGDARLDISYKPFANDFRVSGKTIEIEFATHDVMSYDSPIITCMSGGRGFEVTSQLAKLASEQSSVSMQFKEDEHVRVSFVIEKRAEQRLIYIYINGIMSQCVRYPADDDFAQVSPVNISVGSNDAVVDLYTIRIYDQDLTRQQILTNWIADTQDLDQMVARYTENSVFDDYDQIVISQLPAELPYLILEGAELPQYKGDKKTVGGSYVDPVNRGRSFTFANAEIDVQGTSSQYYVRKNYKLKLKNGYTNSSGAHAEKYAMNDDAIPVSTFCFKADVASSEGCNNVELVRLYDSACPWKTPPQKADPKVRQGIDGFPIVIFWNDGATTQFMGKFNFNNDKSTEDVFGFSASDESWEVLNNTSDRVLFKDSDFGDKDFLSDFEARYPDGNEDGTNLQQLVAWVASTDQSAATGSSIPSVTYDGTSYTTDSKEYRLAKFKAEFCDYFEKDAIIFYYLFTELFLLVDSRAKNMFPTFIGSSKWFSLPYDLDTAIGINNEGSLAFSYNLEDIDKTETGADVFNGQQSVLWINLRAAFYDDIMAMYQDLRSKGKLSYDATEKAFEAHQAKWPAAIFNEDAYFKYLAPLIESGNASYLPMLQGSKEQQRKWWLYNRFRYMDSKYNAGDALTDVITVRGYAKTDITITPYADVYAAVKFGSYFVQKRATRNVPVTLECPLSSVNDTEIYIYSSGQLASVGDLSGLKVGYADFSKAYKLQSIKLGEGGSYTNTNLTDIALGNNRLLKTLDIRNCTNLAQAIDLSGCANIEEIYAEGSVITGLRLPVGGILKKLHVPGTIANLTVRNQRMITDFQMPLTDGRYPNLTTLWIENSSLDISDMLSKVEPNTRLRLIGFNWEMDSVDEIRALFDVFDTMRGLDEQGNNTDKPQISGTLHITELTGAEMAELQARYPTVKITFDHIKSYCRFYSYDGSTLLYTATVVDGGDAVYSGSTPSRSSTAQYTYSFVGWSKSANGSANANALKEVTADRNVYAAFTATVRTYTVTFMNGSTTLQTVQNVPYGGSATYSGDTSALVDPEGSGQPFMAWVPSPNNIVGSTTCKATYVSPVEVSEITDSWDQIIANIENGTYSTVYKVGMYKPLDLGTEGTVNMQIVGIDKDQKADGSGTAPLSFLSKELLKTSKQWGARNLSTTTQQIIIKPCWKYSDADEAWVSNIQGDNSGSATGTWELTPSESGTLTISYKVSSEKNYDKLTLTIAGTKVADAISGEDVDWVNYDLEVTAGSKYTITAQYVKDGSGNKGTDTAYVKWSGVGVEVNNKTSNVTRTITDSYVEGSGTLGGWEACTLRAYYKNTLKPLIPENVRSKIVNVKKTQTTYRYVPSTQGSLEEYGYVTESFQQETTEDVWAPSYPEIFSSLANGGLYSALFKSANDRKKSKVGSTSSATWWLRSAGSADVASFVSSGGYYYDYGTPTITYALALGFCL